MAFVNVRAVEGVSDNKERQRLIEGVTGEGSSAEAAKQRQGG